MSSGSKQSGVLLCTGEREGGSKRLRLHCQLLSAEGALETRRSYSIRRRRSRSLQLPRRASADAGPASLNGDAALRHSLRASLQPDLAKPALAAEAHKQGRRRRRPHRTRQPCSARPRRASVAAVDRQGRGRGRAPVEDQAQQQGGYIGHPGAGGAGAGRAGGAGVVGLRAGRAVLGARPSPGWWRTARRPPRRRRMRRPAT